MTDQALAIRNLKKQYADEQPPAVTGVDLSISDGEIVSLVGPSGCGKSTLLRIIAGLEKPDGGEVILKGTPLVSGDAFKPPQERDVGLVFQDLALFPHMTARENVAYGLSGPAKSTRARVDEMLELVDLTECQERYPEELSGGQRQRVALARTMAVEPSVLMLDEPLSNLDENLRKRIRGDVKGILEEAGIPALFVTHNQEEALYMGNRVAVMRRGRIEQVDPPERITIAPRNRFVASFMGHTDFLPATVDNDTIHSEIGTIPLKDVRLPGDMEQVDLMLRADDLEIYPANGNGGEGTVVSSEFLGGFIRYGVELPSGTRLHSLVPHGMQIDNGTRVRVDICSKHRLTAFPRSSDDE